MQHHDVVPAVVFGVGDGGLAGARQAEGRHDELPSVLHRVALQAAVAGRVAVAGGDAPGQGQGPLLQLAEVAQAQHRGAVLLRGEEREAQREVRVRPVGVGEEEDVAVGVRYPSGGRVARPVPLVVVLKVNHPVVEVVLVALRQEQVGLHHEVLVQPHVGVRLVHPAMARVEDGLAHHGAEGVGVHAGPAHDAARRRRAAEDCAVVEQQDVCVLGQLLLRGVVDGHPRQLDRARAVLRQVVGLLQVQHPVDVVAVEHGLHRRADLSLVHLFKVLLVVSADRRHR